MLPAIARFVVKQTVFISLAIIVMGAATGVIAANPVKFAPVTVP